MWAKGGKWADISSLWGLWVERDWIMYLNQETYKCWWSQGHAPPQDFTGPQSNYFPSHRQLPASLQNDQLHLNIQRLWKLLCYLSIRWRLVKTEAPLTVADATMLMAYAIQSCRQQFKKTKFTQCQIKAKVANGLSSFTQLVRSKPQPPACRAVLRTPDRGTLGKRILQSAP